MKWIKIIVTCGLIAFIFFLISRKDNNADIEGTWTGKRIVLDGVVVYPNNLNEYLKVAPQITVDNWSDSIHIFLPNTKRISARFVTQNDADGNHFIILKSKEKLLNGNFKLEIDTIHLEPRSYFVDVKMSLESTIIYFRKEVYLKPWKPRLPKKGAI